MVVYLSGFLPWTSEPCWDFMLLSIRIQVGLSIISYIPPNLDGVGPQLRLGYSQGKLFYSLIASLLCLDLTIFLP